MLIVLSGRNDNNKITEIKPKHINSEVCIKDKDTLEIFKRTNLLNIKIGIICDKNFKELKNISKLDGYLSPNCINGTCIGDRKFTYYDYIILDLKQDLGKIKVVHFDKKKLKTITVLEGNNLKEIIKKLKKNIVNKFIKNDL